VSISVIVRVRDEADALDHCLALLGEQTGAGAGAELIVVDNDSSDGSGAVARRRGAQVVRISRDRFTFGRALNLGASVAHSNVLVALSAHAFVHDSLWLDRTCAWFEDPTVACVSGDRFWPDGSQLHGPIRYGARLATGYPRWGYSNAAGAFRAQCWTERHFREDLTGAEDKEWARYWARERGRVTVLDPSLVVEHDHTHDPVLDIFARARRESAGFRAFLDPPATTRSFASEWFWDTRFYSNPWRARLSHRRLARLLGERTGRLDGRAVSRIGAYTGATRNDVRRTPRSNEEN
jgi:glycosyltransferase involved in cell wall biosynthesis